MKKVEAIIRPSKLKAVQRGLKEAEIPCITVIPVKGTGLQKSYSERYRGTEQSMILQSRVMIMCVIKENATENQVGDGKIFIYHVEDAIRLSNGTTGVDAII